MKALPSICVLDASVIIKVFVNESHSGEIRDLLRQRDADTASVLLVPDLLFVECANILWKRVRREGYPADSAKANLAELKSFGLSSTPTSNLIERALEIACDCQVTAYDACYAALAEQTGVPFVTADHRLAAALKGTPLAVLTLGR
ncbi:MAG: type II toxin-antitoxin system VapC family toxin [Armatimonadota bacterium]